MDFGQFAIFRFSELLTHLLWDPRAVCPPEAGGVVRMRLSDFQDASGVIRSDFDDFVMGFELIQNFAMGIWNHRRAYRGARPALAKGCIIRGPTTRWLLVQLLQCGATVNRAKV